jgi:hypothetical protein
MPARFTDFKGNVHNALDVLQWVKENVPCFKGMIPREWTQAVYAEGRPRGINHAVARQALIWASRSGYQFDLSSAPVTDAVAYMSKAEKLKEGILRSPPYLPDNLKSFAQALAEPKALAIMVATLLVWAGSHAFGIGEVVDLILLSIGVLFAGFSIFSGAGELVEFVETALDASTYADLDEAGQHFARAVVLLGVATIQAALLRSSVKTYRKPWKLERPLPPPGTRPTINYKLSLRDGVLSKTDEYGDIEISQAQSPAERVKALTHEKVHRFFTPVAQALRKLRVEAKVDMYWRSAFLRYLEEVLCEGWSQLLNNGMLGPLASLRAIYFPISEGYITLSQVMMGGNLVGTITLAGRRIYVFISMGEPPVEMQ